MLAFSIIAGAAFGLLAAAAAFVITWEEYQKHKFTGKRLFLRALYTAIFAFVIFLLLSLLAGFCITLALL